MEYTQAVINFLGVATSAVWLNHASQHLDLLLIDHAHCEKKAASNALNLLFKYVEFPQLNYKLSRLAREELRHFEKVLQIMQRRGIVYRHLQPSLYAPGLRAHCRTYEPERLIDVLIISSFIEARSCERFAALIPYIDHELAKFYYSLLKSEARHFEDYLDLAREIANDDLTDRIAFFREQEVLLITAVDPQFRFHSGVPNVSIPKAIRK